MKYIITESQYKLLTEDNILRLDFNTFDKDWNILKLFLDKKGNPPYKIIGDLDLKDSRIESFGNLKHVDGNLSLKGSHINSLGSLKSVKGNLDLFQSHIESLGNLKHVAGDLILKGSYINSLGDIQYVGGNLDLFHSDIESLGNLQYVGGDMDLSLTPLARKITRSEIENRVEVGGVIRL
jgi:hypothetical protein